MADPIRRPNHLQLGTVALVRWPEESAVRQALASSGAPRLLLVAPHVDPPTIIDDLEDWVRDPSPPAEVAARVATLRRRADHHAEAPELDDDGLLRRGSRWVAIPETMIPVLKALLRHPNQLVRDRHLIAAYADGGGSASPVAIKSMLNRLDLRVQEIGLRLRRVKSRGVVLIVPTPHRGVTQWLIWTNVR